MISLVLRTGVVGGEYLTLPFKREHQWTQRSDQNPPSPTHHFRKCRPEHPQPPYPKQLSTLHPIQITTDMVGFKYETR